MSRMTQGEMMVWAASYALASRNGQHVPEACRTAADEVLRLRVGTMHGAQASPAQAAEMLQQVLKG